MARGRRLIGQTWMLIAAMVVGCAAPALPPPAQTGGERPAAAQAGSTMASQSTTPKRLVMALYGDIVTLSDTARQSGPIGTATTMEGFLNAGVAIHNDQGVLIPELAEAVPTLESGAWKLNADGSMQTTYKLKPGVTWHDGAPFTSDDLLFTTTLEGDREVPRASRNAAYAAISSVDAPDPQTFLINWKQPYIDADLMFTLRSGYAQPIPKHILEKPYLDDKQNVMQHPHWTTSFVGLGPYRMKDFVQGSHVVLSANPNYVRGKPKIDEVELRIVSDANTAMSNLLSGTAQMLIGSNTLTVDEGLELGNQWPNSAIEWRSGANQWLVIFPQFVNTNPAILQNVQFRRALVHAIDRQSMVDTLQHGKGEVMHTFLAPSQPDYREIEARVPKYNYDPNRAQQIIQELGYAKRADGLYYDASGQKLSVELRTTNRVGAQLNGLTTVSDFWQRAGVGVDQVIIPIQRQTDAQYRATFPSFEMLGPFPNDVQLIPSLVSSAARLPENNFVSLNNYPRYMNLELDGLVDRYLVTTPMPERLQVLGQIVNHVAENVAWMPIMSLSAPYPYSKRIQGVAIPQGVNGRPTWNIHSWDLT